MMIDSGARGNTSNFTQLVGLRGLMYNPKGEIIEVPVISSFSEGLTIYEFFISTHGARKGMTDIALKTADSGYLTRRLVDAAQEVIVTEDDCHTKKSFEVYDIIDTKTNTIIVPLYDRLVGRHVAEDIFDKHGNIIIQKNALISKKIAKEIVAANKQRVKIRNVVTCEAKNAGVCTKCYGINLAYNEPVKIGEAVGIIAAQSIGEPGTQLTMRNFHSGGVASGSDITQGLPRVKELFDVTIPKGRISVISKVEGRVSNINELDNNAYEIVVSYQRKDGAKHITEDEVHHAKINSILRVKVGENVKICQKLTDGNVNLRELLEIGDVTEVHKYIIKEIQRVYRLQGIEISDKYVEIIVRQMLRQIAIIDPGDTELLPGSHIDVDKFYKVQKDMIKDGKRPAFGKPIIFGIKKAPLETDSWLAGASFQDTTRVLANAAVAGAVDHLRGLKENIIVGNLIPAGTGLLSSEEIIAAGEQALAERY